jgi:hypothetical protein
MSKSSQPVSPQELLQGIKELKANGVELKGSPESILNQVILNTSKNYLAKKYKINKQPSNIAEARSEACSKLLRKSMESAKRFGPEDTDAHHIVPGADNRCWARQYAEAARAILRRWGIAINDEANGVYLPSSSKVTVPTLPNAYPHKKTHTKVYYMNIAEHLAGATGKKDCLEILREIGEDLEDGIYPIRKGMI